jgi:hypothetical protein
MDLLAKVRKGKEPFEEAGDRVKLAAMPDDKSKTGGQDRKRINVNEDYELRDWSKSLGVSPDRLKEIVKKVGPMVDDVRRELGR